MNRRDTPHRCTKCRVKIPRGTSCLCRVTERASVHIDLNCKITRFVATSILPYCSECEAFA